MEELREMLASSSMEIFAPACKALGDMGTEEAYSLLKEHLQTKDKYQYRAPLF